MPPGPVLAATLPHPALARSLFVERKARELTHPASSGGPSQTRAERHVSVSKRPND